MNELLGFCSRVSGFRSLVGVLGAARSPGVPDPAPFVRVRSPAGENKQKDKKQELSKTFDAVKWYLWCGTEGTTL